MPRRRASARRAGIFLALLSLLGPAVAAAQTAWSTPATRAPDAVARAINDLAGDDLASFYRDRGWWPLWSDRGRIAPQARALVALVRTVAADGLDPDAYAPAELDRAIADAASGDPQTLAAADVLLSSTLAQLVADMRAPRMTLDYADASLAPTRPSADAVLRRAAVAPDFARYMRELGWMHPLYVGLRAALLGEEQPRRATPRIELDLADAALFGGAVPHPSRAALPRAALLRRNLERARLLPDASTRHIVVDAAGARLWYYADGAAAGTMRVVTGQPDTPTPMLAGTIGYATLNPYWNVPVDLVRKRIAPKVLAGQSLRALGYEALSGWEGDARALDPAAVDWRAVAAGTSEVRVRELPGGANSMGTVKFTFPNDEGIYLHDTNNRALFAEADRHFSNGCVRLEDASRLARWLFGRDLTAKTGTPEEAVPLPQPVPVYVLYFTALPDDGEIVAQADVYGRDHGVQTAAR